MAAPTYCETAPTTKNSGTDQPGMGVVDCTIYRLPNSPRR
jgi:hypothetical protein